MGSKTQNTSPADRAQKRDYVPLIGGFVSALLLAAIIGQFNSWRDSIRESEVLREAVIDIVALKKDLKALSKASETQSGYGKRLDRMEETLTQLRIRVEGIYNYRSSRK